MSNQQERFDEWADVYDAVVRNRTGFPFAGYEDVLNTVVQSACADSGDRVLDLGIGTGALAAHFAEKGCSIWGLDVSEKMLERARKRCPQATLYQADLLGEWPPTLPAHLDAVVSAYVFHHFDVEQKLQLIDRALNVLVAGQRVVIGDIGFKTAAQRKRARTRWAREWDGDEFYWAWDEACHARPSLAEHARFTQVSACGVVIGIEKRGCNGV